MPYAPQWTIEPYITKKALIQKLTAPGSISPFSSCIKHQYKGTAFAGVLYAVFDNPSIISLFILKTDPKSHGWTWKRQDEKDHPLYKSCPKAYLDLVPIACQAWRDECLKQEGPETAQVPSTKSNQEPPRCLNGI